MAKRKRCSASLITGDADQNHSEITSHLLEWLLTKGQKISIGEDVEIRESGVLLAGM